MRRGTTDFVTTAALLAVVGFFGAPALAAGCFTADAPEAVLLPDGQLYPAGEIKICPVRQLTPISTLHRVSIDGADVGFFLGRRAAFATDPAGRSTVQFARRDAGDALELYSVAYLSSGEHRSFRADRIGRGRVPQVRTEESITGIPADSVDRRDR